MIYHPAPQFKPNLLESTIKPPSITTNLLGGIYFTTDFSIGRIELAFAGVLNKRPLNWYISAIPKQLPLTGDSLTLIDEENSFIYVKFMHEEGFMLKNLCNIKLENRHETYCTNEHGIAKIPISVEDKVIILLNEKKAACGRKGEELEVICKFLKGTFIPKKPTKKCE